MHGVFGYRGCVRWLCRVRRAGQGGAGGVVLLIPSNCWCCGVLASEAHSVLSFVAKWRGEVRARARLCV